MSASGAKPDLRNSAGQHLFELAICSFFVCYSNSVVSGEMIPLPKTHLKLVTPTTKNRTVTPKRLKNADLRAREYLTDAETMLKTGELFNPNAGAAA